MIKVLKEFRLLIPTVEGILGDGLKSEINFVSRSGFAAADMSFYGLDLKTNGMLGELMMKPWSSTP